MDAQTEALLKSRIRDIPDYPSKGVLFRDITPMLGDSAAFSACINEMSKAVGNDIDYVVGVEARGFIIGSAVAYKLGKGFIPVRKKGKLPYRKVGMDYELEYGKASIEVHEDALERGKRVAIVDDLLATGGTSKAAAELARRIGGEVAGLFFVIELSGLKGRERLAGERVTSLLTY